MNVEELKELMSLLKEADVRAELCDNPIKVSECGVKCGLPTEIGDNELADYIMLPKSVVGMYPEMFIPAEGDSMIGAGYESGDMLRVRFGMTAHDGDSVLAWIDGKCTVKSYYKDEDNQQWLVPQNDDYDSIPLTEDMDFRILGVVVGVEKASCRMPSRSLIQSIRRTKNKLKTAKRMSEKEVDECIIKIGSDVKHARQWYAVYRAMLDCQVTNEGDYMAFCSRVRFLLPEHEHLPTPKEISRMAVQSFARPVSMWNNNNAPVSGVRYKDYLNVALIMGSYLSKTPTEA
jgi:hypothetical protein